MTLLGAAVLFASVATGQTDDILACDDGDLDACLDAAQALRDLPIPDLSGALEMDQAACNLGDLEACTRAAVMLIEGEGADPDPARALTYLTEACNGGEPDACYHAAELFEAGSGTDRDTALAIRLLNIACDGDVNRACSHRLLAAAEAFDAIEWVRISAGSFVMGSPESEPNRRDSETLHDVTLTRDFEMASTEITQSTYMAMLGVSPTRFASCGGDCPQDMLNFWEALRLTNALSDSQGLDNCYVLEGCTGTGELTNLFTCQSFTFEGYDCEGYRLPSEAEWEYAARAGENHMYTCGDTPVCLLDAACFGEETTCPVGEHEPNEWGLYDMNGNVSEWVNDLYISRHPDAPTTDPTGGNPATAQHQYRTIRGGSFQYEEDRLRTAFRSNDSPGVRSPGYGVRPVRTLHD